jgi:hypothetical protein
LDEAYPLALLNAWEKYPWAMWVERAAKEEARECIGGAAALRSRIELVPKVRAL